MKIPKTTKDKPYIEFRVDKKGNIKLSISSSWWGGKNGGFSGSGGTEGNTCLPKDLNTYIKAFKASRVKSIKKEIANLQNLIAKYNQK